MKNQQVEAADKVKIRELLEDNVSLDKETQDDVFLDKETLIKISGILNTIRANAIETGSTTPESLDSLVLILNKHGVSVDSETLRNFIDQPPLNNIAAPPRGDKVYFIGQRGFDDGAVTVTQNSGTLEKMAKKALKSRT